MSTLSQFFSGIKSIQRGVTNVNTSPGSATVTVTAVNTAKTVVNLIGSYSTSGSDIIGVSAVLTNSTTLTLISFNAGGTGSNPVSWELVESY